MTNYQVLSKTFRRADGQEYSLAYSKIVSANGRNQPIVGTEPMTNKVQPCPSLLKNQLLLAEDDYTRIFLPLENTIETAEACPV